MMKKTAPKTPEDKEPDQTTEKAFAEEKAETAIDDKKPEEPFMPMPTPTKVRKKGSFINRELSLGGFLISQILILVIGLAFLGGLFYLLNPEAFVAKSNYANPVTTNPLSLYLNINNPNDELLTYDSSVVISGKTNPDATVILSSPEEDEAVTASKLGEFSKVFPLVVGLNVIQISAFDDQGNSKTETRTVYYTEDKLQ